MNSSLPIASSGNVRSLEQGQTVQWRKKDITPLSCVLMGAVAGGAMGSLLGPLGTLAGAIVGVAVGIIASAFGYAAAVSLHSQPNASIVVPQKNELGGSMNVDVLQEPSLSEITPPPSPSSEEIPAKSENTIPDSAIVPVAKIWRAAQAINDLSNPEIPEKDKTKLTSDELKEVYKYCLDATIACFVPQNILNTVIAKGKEDEKVSKLSSQERYSLAAKAIESHPRFKSLAQDTKEALTFRLYNASFSMADPREALNSSWLTKDLI